MHNKILSHNTQDNGNCLIFLKAAQKCVRAIGQTHFWNVSVVSAASLQQLQHKQIHKGGGDDISRKQTIRPFSHKIIHLSISSEVCLFFMSKKYSDHNGVIIALYRHI